MNRKGKEKMEDAASGSFSISRNQLILPENYEAALSLVQMKEAAWNLLHMKQQRLGSRTAKHLQELISKNNQTCVPPKVQASFPKENRTANHLQELIGKNNQTCVPPKVEASFPIESLRHLVGQFSSCLKKQLTDSDIKGNQMRLMFPKRYVEKDIKPLLKDGESPKRGIPTTLYFVNPRTKQDRSFPMIYKSWGEDKTYVLTSGWLTFVQKCKINVGDTIKLWVFRHSKTGYLSFALTLSLSDDR